MPPTCATVSLDHYSQQGLELRWLDDPDHMAAGGLNSWGVGSTDTLDWHQPAPGDALSVPRSASLKLWTYHDHQDLPPCIEAVSIAAAPFSATATPPDAAALVPITSSDASSEDANAISLVAPEEAGDWVLRVAVVWRTEPEPSHQETFFRLFVDTPPPAVRGSATAPVPCAQPGDHPPHAFLSVGGGASLAGEGGSFTWRLVSGDGPYPIGPRVEADQGSELSIAIQDDICAGWWSMLLAPRPAPAFAPQEAFLELVPAHRDYQVRPLAANRFTLDTVPQGDWVVEAFLDYAGPKGHVIGQTTNFWNVVVQ